jgi:hypothetical protein
MNYKGLTSTHGHAGLEKLLEYKSSYFSGLFSVHCPQYAPIGLKTQRFITCFVHFGTKENSWTSAQHPENTQLESCPTLELALSIPLYKP